MLFKQNVLDGILAGNVTRAFRRWKRPTVKPGGTLKTSVGVVAIGGVVKTALKDITERDAKLAGHGSLRELLKELRKHTGTVYRIDLHFQGKDPRIKLRQRDKLSNEELGSLIARLEGMDARSKHGPWTRRVLTLLRDNEGVRAGDLAPQVERETLHFKRDVRKLKNLGLTESLGTGYRLSPRGRVVLNEMS